MKVFNKNNEYVTELMRNFDYIIMYSKQFLSAKKKRVKNKFTIILDTHCLFINKCPSFFFFFLILVDLTRPPE